jgi:phosphonate dehydrogenase
MLSRSPAVDKPWDLRLRAPNPKVVVTNWVHPEVVSFLARHGFVVEANANRHAWPRAELCRRINDADALIAFMSDHVTDDLLADCPRLKIIAAALKGYDNFDVAACTRRGIWLSIVPDLLTAPTAEFAIGLAIALARNITAGDRLIRRGGYAGWRPILYGASLTGATIGIVGMGAVGSAIAERLHGFEPAQILYCDARKLDRVTRQWVLPEPAPFDRVLSESDFLFLALPLDTRTKHIIDRDALARMRPGCLLINPARGSLVDEEAVADALAAGCLAGYAADAFEMEDWGRGVERPRRIAKRLLAEDGRTVLTPHLGSAVDAARRDVAMEAAHNVVDWIEGRAPRGAVNRLQRSLARC